MGTRADFYVSTDSTDMEWLGSVGWDGSPEGINSENWRPSSSENSPVLAATSEEEYRAALEEFFSGRADATRPEDGWPWPWNDSRSTDYAYTFDDRQVLCSRFGCPWQTAIGFKDVAEGGHEETEEVEFPDMTGVQRVTFGPRSGLIVYSASEGSSIDVTGERR